MPEERSHESFPLRILTPSAPRADRRRARRLHAELEEEGARLAGSIELMLDVDGIDPALMNRLDRDLARLRAGIRALRESTPRA